MSSCIGLVDIQSLVGLKTTGLSSGLSYKLDVNGKNKKVNGNWNINKDEHSTFHTASYFYYVSGRSSKNDKNSL